MKSYAREIVVSNTPGAAYLALTAEFDKWWAPVSNSVNEVGETITFRFSPTYWTMRVNKLVLDKSVELECIEANHIHDGLPSSILKEWEGSILTWDIQGQDNNTKISFVHEGLVPSLQCYDICKAGWDYYFMNSLQKYQDVGTGTPYADDES